MRNPPPFSNHLGFGRYAKPTAPSGPRPGVYVAAKELAPGTRIAHQAQWIVIKAVGGSDIHDLKLTCEGVDGPVVVHATEGYEFRLHAPGDPSHPGW